MQLTDLNLIFWFLYQKRLRDYKTPRESNLLVNRYQRAGRLFHFHLSVCLNRMTIVFLPAAYGEETFFRRCLLFSVCIFSPHPLPLFGIQRLLMICWRHTNVLNWARHRQRDLKHRHYYYYYCDLEKHQVI